MRLRIIIDTILFIVLIKVIPFQFKQSFKSAFLTILMGKPSVSPSETVSEIQLSLIIVRQISTLFLKSTLSISA